MSNENKVSEVRTSQIEPDQERQIFTYKTSQWIWLLLGIVVVLIALRIGLKLMGANPESPIAALIYGLTGPLLLPFVGLTGSLTSGAAVFETSSLYAIGIYCFVAAAFERIIRIIFYRPRGPVAAVTETTTSESHTTL